MEWLGVWNCIFSGSEFSNFGAWNLAKIALSAVLPGFCWKNRLLKHIFRTLENGHSIRHQSIPPLIAGRYKHFRGGLLGRESRILMLGTSQNPPNLEKFKVAQKWPQKWLSGGPPKVTRKWPEKWLFDPKKSVLSHFSGQKVTLRVTFESPWGSHRKSLLGSHLSYFEFFGVSGGFGWFPASQV